MPETNVQTMTVQLDQKKIAELQESAPKILAQAKEFEIVTEEDYEASGSMLTMVAKRQQVVLDFFAEPAKQANNVHKFITTLRSTLVLPYQQAEAVIKTRRRDYRNEQERLRLLLEEEKRKKAKDDADARAIEEAAELQQIGETDAAETIIARAAIAPAPAVFVPSNVPKQAGHSIRKVWKFRVKNPVLHKREFLMLDESKAQALVDSLGPDAESIVGGIEVYQEEIETTRRR